MIFASARSSAPPDAVFAVIADGARWSEWAFMRHSSLDRDGDPAPDGVGAIRKLGTPPFFSREEIVESVPPRRLAYVLRSGLPLRSYRAEVDLAPDGDGTAISWRGEIDARGVVAAIAAWGMQRMIQSFATGAARRAEQLTR